jgi:hypothetical protein
MLRHVLWIVSRTSDGEAGAMIRDPGESGGRLCRPFNNVLRKFPLDPGSALRFAQLVRGA